MIDEEDVEVPETDDQEIAEEALKNFKFAAETYADQQKREREDLEFQVPELQWDPEARIQRAGNMQGNVPVPPRPCISISKIDQPIKLVRNQMQTAHLGVNIYPVNEQATDETAEVLQDLYRTIERDSRASLARTWAFDRAIKAGRGCYRVNTVYDDQSDNPSDQKIVIQRVLYQDSAYFDPSAIEPDCSDAKWGFLTSWMDAKDFKRKYPHAEISDMDKFMQESVLKTMPDWVTFDGGKRGVRVAEYWKKHYSTETIGEGDFSREKEKVKLMWYLLCPGTDCLEVLDSKEWNGPDIPIIPAIGTELQPFDGERRWHGMIRPARDPQKVYNYAASTVIEMVALEPKAPFVGAEGQFDGHESKWGQANTRNFPYLEYKPVALNGQAMPPPQRVQVDVGRLGPSMELLRQADDFIQAATSTPDPALGNLTSRDRSGKAITALQGQSQASKSDFLENFAQVSMQYEAKVILGMIPRVYDRPGRIARVLNMQDESRNVMLNAPHVMDSQTGRPQRVSRGTPPPVPPAGMPLPPGYPQAGPSAQGISSGVPPGVPAGGFSPQGPPQAMQGPPQAPQGPQGPLADPSKPAPKVRMYDLSLGAYGVAVTIGKSWTTRLEQGADEIGELLKGSPDLMPLIGPLYFKYRDFPGHTEIGELMRKVREKTHPGIDAKPGEETPEQLKAQLEGQKKQMTDLQQQLQEATKQIETEQAKQQAVVQRSQIEAQAKTQSSDTAAQVQMQVEQMRAQSDAQIEEMKSQAALQLEQMKEEFKLAVLKQEQRFEAMQQQLDRQQTEDLAEHSAREAQNQDDRDMMHEMNQADMDRKAAGTDEE